MPKVIEKYSFWIACFVTLLACVYAYFNFLLPLDVFLWDESHHGVFSMQIYRDLSAGDWGSFWAHTNSQALWMPLHSWISGLFLYLFGFSYASARLSSLFLFFLSSILVFFIGCELSKEKSWLIGLMAVLLFITSPAILHLSVMNMQELLGIFVLLGLIYFMVRFMDLEAVWKYLVIGFLVSIAYWSKSNYALQLIFGLGLFQLTLLWKTKKREVAGWFIQNLWIIVGFLPLFGLWWLTPPFARKYALGVAFRSQGVGEALFYPSVNFFQRVIFYLQSLVASYTFSLWLGLGFLFALGAGSRLLENKKIRLMLLLFLANLVMISFVGNIQERYISTTAPLIFLLFAYVLVINVPTIQGYLKKAARPVLVLLAVIALSILWDGFCLTRYTKEVANRSILFPIYKQHLNKFSPPFLFGVIKRPAFTYPMEQTKRYLDFKTVPESRLQDVLDFFSLTIERNQSISTLISYHELSPYVIYWHFQGWNALVFTGYDQSAPGGRFWNSDYFIDVKALPDSPYYIECLDKGWNEKIGPVLLRAGAIKLVAAKEFTDLGLLATVYKREKQIVLK